jgi:hypothetical protein
VQQPGELRSVTQFGEGEVRVRGRRQFLRDELATEFEPVDADALDRTPEDLARTAFAPGAGDPRGDGQ